MTRRLIEYRAVMTTIPARSAGTRKRVCTVAVAAPARAPAATAISAAAGNGRPAVMAEAAQAAPRGKLPSTVRSGKSRTRNVMNTPMARMP